MNTVWAVYNSWHQFVYDGTHEETNNFMLLHYEDGMYQVPMEPQLIEIESK